MIASANHDELVFAASNEFKIDRVTNPHLGFGGSVHFCLGSAFARLQARVALEELLAAFPKITCADHEPLQYLDSFFFRGVKRLALAVESV